MNIKEKIEIKKKLYEACTLFVDKRNQTIIDIIESNRKALESENKSSAGDKHETGRAMLQLEIEKASQQFSSVRQMYKVLNRISSKANTVVISLGSVVKTTLNNYFISVSIGEIYIEDEKYFAVSPKSPIGYLLLGKKKGDKTEFNGKTFQIIEVF